MTSPADEVEQARTEPVFLCRPSGANQTSKLNVTGVDSEGEVRVVELSDHLQGKASKLR